MSIRQKLRSIITEIKESTSAKNPTSDDALPSQLVESPAVAKFKEHLAETSTDPLKEQEILNSIQADYYKSAEEFDSSLFELNKLPVQLQLMEIDQDRKRLKRQLQSVSRHVSELVLENHPAYAAELARVMELDRTLQNALMTCVQGRRQLFTARQNFTIRGLQLMANVRKRQQLHKLLAALGTIKTLQRTDVRLRELLEEEDFAGAIQLCLQCQKVIETHSHFTCISDLGTKLQDTLDTLEESLDVALSKTCMAFDPLHYGKLQEAYRLLGKTQSAMDQLHMHFTAAVHNKAFQIVLGFVQLCAPASEMSYQKKQYADLCTHITQEVFNVCLLALCKSLWEMMRAYRRTMDWHKLHDALDKNTTTEAVNEGIMSVQYIHHKLENGRARLWAEIQQKVKVYLLSSDLSVFKYDELMQVLDIVNRLIQIGDEFCGSQSEGLQESIRKQSLGYFKNYHRARLDDLHIFLENEVWELCPVKSNFSVFLLQEFRYLKRSYQTANEDTNLINTSYFEKFEDNGSPFDVDVEEDTTEDVFESIDNGWTKQRTLSQETDSDDDINDELKQDFVDEDRESKPRSVVTRRLSSRNSIDKSTTIVTNTTLNVCRLFGKYMQLTSVLKPIAFDVILCMSQLYDYYLYAVYCLFVKSSSQMSDSATNLSPRLKATISRISENLVFNSSVLAQMGEEDPDGTNMAAIRDKVPEPRLSPAVNLYAVEGLCGLSERIVATESLIFLSTQLQQLAPHLQAVIPVNKQAFLQQFFSQTVTVASELRHPTYMVATVHLFDYDALVHMMASVRYDIKDIMSQHSPYVDSLLKEVARFRERLDVIGQRVPVSREVLSIVWSHATRRLCSAFVDGYANTKKCTNEGRALMQLDFQQFVLKLEKLTEIRPVAGKEYVETYIKAYYLPETQLETWLTEHKEYSPRQLLALVSCVQHIGKKSRQKLTNLLEDLEKPRKQ